MKFIGKVGFYTGFTLAIMLMVITGLVSYITLQDQLQHAEKVKHSYKVLGDLENFEKLFVNMETGRRGFRATHDSAFLEPYLRNLPLLFPTLDRLEQSVMQNSIGVDKTDKLIADAKKLDSFWRNLRPAHTYVHEEKKNVTRDEKKLMDLIRADITWIRSAENEVLDSRLIANDRAIKRAIWSIGISTLLTLIVVVVLYSIIIREFRARRKAKRELQQNFNTMERLNGQLERFTYIVAHDLKSPLAGVTALVSLMQEDERLKNEADLQEYMAMMTEATGHLSGMITSILEYSRDTYQKERAEKVDAHQLVEQIIQLLYPPKHIHISIKGQLPELYTYKLKLQQVFQNFISNSIKYNDKPEGYITVSCDDDGEFYCFCIEDNGPGIAEKDQERIFKLFQVTDNKTTNDSSTGVGLNIVKMFVEEQGGQIKVESVPGKGSKFYFQWRKTAQDLA